MTADLVEGRQSLRLVRDRLLHPTEEALTACLPDLDRAWRCLQGADRNTVARSELAAFRQELREVNALVRTGADYYLDCIQLLAGGRASYGPGGRIVAGD